MGKFNLKKKEELTDISKFVRDCLQSSLNFDLKKIVVKLKKLGVNTVKDFSRLTDEDLIKDDQITLVQARTLLSSAKDGELRNDTLWCQFKKHFLIGFVQFCLSFLCCVVR